MRDIVNKETKDLVNKATNDLANEATLARDYMKRVGTGGVKTPRTSSPRF